MTLPGDPLPAGFCRRARRRSGSACRPSAIGVIYFNTIGSTNDVALALAMDGDADGAVALADEQTAGRGRLGRRWFSPPGSGLYVSTVLQLPRASADPQRAIGLLTPRRGFALAKRSRPPRGFASTSSGPTIWWSRGASSGSTGRGVVVERRPRPREAPHGSSLATAINIRSTAYPSDLRDRTTSLENSTRKADRQGDDVCRRRLRQFHGGTPGSVAGRFDAILGRLRSRAAGGSGARVTWSNAASGPEARDGRGVTTAEPLLIRVGDHLETIVGGASIGCSPLLTTEDTRTQGRQGRQRTRCVHWNFFMLLAIDAAYDIVLGVFEGHRFCVRLAVAGRCASEDRRPRSGLMGVWLARPRAHRSRRDRRRCRGIGRAALHADHSPDGNRYWDADPSCRPDHERRMADLV